MPLSQLVLKLRLFRVTTRALRATSTLNYVSFAFFNKRRDISSSLDWTCLRLLFHDNLAEAAVAADLLWDEFAGNPTVRPPLAIFTRRLYISPHTVIPETADDIFTRAVPFPTNLPF